jgi:LacI family transcriptional regulator
VYRAAQQAGLRIPQDLSVVTFEDSQYFRMLDPQISGLVWPWNEVGRTALEMLVRQMDRKGAPPRGQYEHHVLQPEWIGGKSLAAPSAPAAQNSRRRV